MGVYTQTRAHTGKVPGKVERTHVHNYTHTQKRMQKYMHNSFTRLGPLAHTQHTNLPCGV